LERGVTFPNINVLVLEADQTVFNEATLIQIAGRVGRVTAEGEVVFTSKFISEEMINAKKSIIEFNREKNDLRPL
jgi:competence protein ComFA